MENIEKWKAIEGYEDAFIISNDGTVRSLDRCVTGAWGNTVIKKGKVRKTYKQKNGCRIILSKDYATKAFYVHRLVWESFNGKIPDGYIITHINGNKSDNRLENLELKKMGDC